MSNNDGQILRNIVDLAYLHSSTWRDKSDSYWLSRLMQEVGELASSLVGDHCDPVDRELEQIASICINWLRRRYSNEQ
jgi:hypothetical protein